MTYDCIVLGVGGIGSAALNAAAKRGWSVLGIDRFGGAHDRGSSHGRTRIIRTAYFEHPHYVPLARQAWDAWNNLQSMSATPLVKQSGLLQIGSESGSVVQGVMRSASEHDIRIEKLSSQHIAERYPALKIPYSQMGIFEASAGYLLVENCVSVILKQAQDRGAEFLPNTTVDHIGVDDTGTITVHAGQDRFQSSRLIMTLGPWAADLLGDLPIDLTVLRKQQQWFQIDRVDVRAENGFPAFLIEDDEQCFYGFPEIDYLGMKIAEHSGGAPTSDPLMINRDCDADDLSRVERFMDKYMNFSRRRLVHQSACMYTMTTDGHCILDRHPTFPQIALAAGLSGHGFKFAPLLGERLVGLLENETQPMFDFLSLQDRNLQILHQ